MSHVHISAISAVLARKLNRICPSCGAKQTVKKDQLKQNVPCAACGANIPPPGEGTDASR